jgi:hypothetical protein
MDLKIGRGDKIRSGDPMHPWHSKHYWDMQELALDCFRAQPSVVEFRSQIPNFMGYCSL